MRAIIEKRHLKTKPGLQAPFFRHKLQPARYFVGGFDPGFCAGENVKIDRFAIDQRRWLETHVATVGGTQLRVGCAGGVRKQIYREIRRPIAARRSMNNRE